MWLIVIKGAYNPWRTTSRMYFSAFDSTKCRLGWSLTLKITPILTLRHQLLYICIHKGPIWGWYRSGTVRIMRSGHNWELSVRGGNVDLATCITYRRLLVDSFNTTYVGNSHRPRSAERKSSHARAIMHTPRHIGKWRRATGSQAHPIWLPIARGISKPFTLYLLRICVSIIKYYNKLFRNLWKGTALWQ